MKKKIVEKAIELRKKGKTWREIGEILGQSKENIRFYVRNSEWYKKNVALKRTSPEDLVLVISDVHWGRVTYRRDGKLDFCVEKARKRIRRVKDVVLKLRDILKRSYDFNGLWLLFLGDIIDGELTFPNQQMHIETPELKQVLEAVNEFYDFIVEMRKYFPKVSVRGVYGNHAGDKRKHEINRGDMYFYKILEDRFRGEKKIDVKFSEFFYEIVEINHHKFLLFHGDGIRSYMGIPFYGVKRWGMNRLKTYGEDWKYLLLGHFHTLGYFNFSGFEVFMNGTLMTNDEHSLRWYGRDGDSRWWFLSVHKDRGVTFTYKIELKEEE